MLNSSNKNPRVKCVSHRDFYKHYIIALSSGQMKLELGFNVQVLFHLYNYISSSKSRKYFAIFSSLHKLYITQTEK